MRVNGALCGQLQVAADTSDPALVPDWLVVGLDLVLLQTTEDPGETPDRTALYEEGCADVPAEQLLESWARHVMTWINRWESDGNGPLHSEWMGLVQGVGEAVTRAGRAWAGDGILRFSEGVQGRTRRPRRTQARGQRRRGCGCDRADDCSACDGLGAG